MQGPLEEIYLMVGIDQFFGELAEFSYLSMGKLIQEPTLSSSRTNFSSPESWSSFG